ncbi:methylmalonate-semialdehyde dehydrogenase, partial [Burkholderia sp. TJI49]
MHRDRGQGVAAGPNLPAARHSRGGALKETEAMSANPTPRTGQDVPTVKLLIDGAFVESATSEWRDIVNPATQQVLARVPFATVAEVDAAVQAAHTAYATWKNTPIAARMRIMLKFQDLVRTNLPRIAKTLTAEQGKTIPDAE